MKLIFGAILLSAACANAALTELDAYTVSALDKLVRQDLVMMVVERVNDSISLQKTMQTGCAEKINTTSLACQNCLKLHPNQTQGGSGNIMNQVLPVILSPGIEIGKLLEYVAKTAAQKVVVDLIGKNIVKLGKELGSTAKHAGDFLLGGVNDTIYGIGDGFEKLGKELASITYGIGNGLDNFGKDVAKFGNGLSNGLENIGKGLVSGATDAANAVSNTAHNIAHGIDQIGHGIDSIFGKRSVCPTCDKIQNRNTDQIIDGVCGANYMTEQNQVITEIGHMKDIYSAAVNTTIIQKVEYDPTSIDVSHGVQFTKVFITFSLNGKSSRYATGSHLALTDLPTMAKSLTNEIYESYV